jgi:hypothetical protein
MDWFSGARQWDLAPTSHPASSIALAVGVRQANPAEKLVRDGRWPRDDPLRIYLPEDADTRVPTYVQPHAGDDLVKLRSRAIGAFFLGTGAESAPHR